MSRMYRIYCDESSHLERDRHPLMVLGAIWCPADQAAEISIRIKQIKDRHGLPPTFEVKWSKVSEAGKEFYRDLVDYFFDDDDLNFRAVVSPKGSLRHDDFAQDHDGWYYKMQYQLLSRIMRSDRRFEVFIDIKDSRSQQKVRLLHQVLANSLHDFDRSLITLVQQVRSHEVQQVQLADLFAGAINYAGRELDTNSGKMAVIEHIRRRSGRTLLQSTLPGEQKFNVFWWRPA